MSSIVKRWEWNGFKIPLCRYRIHVDSVTQHKLNEIPEINEEIRKEVMEAKNEIITGKR